MSYTQRTRLTVSAIHAYAMHLFRCCVQQSQSSFPLHSNWTVVIECSRCQCFTLWSLRALNACCRRPHKHKHFLDHPRGGQIFFTILNSYLPTSESPNSYSFILIRKFDSALILILMRNKINLNTHTHSNSYSLILTLIQNFKLRTSI